MDGWMKKMAAEPNACRFATRQAERRRHAGAFQGVGMGRARRVVQGAVPDATESVALALTTPKQFSATLTTSARIPGDATSSRTKNELPAYVAFQGDGDVTAPIVYAPTTACPTTTRRWSASASM